MRRPAGSIERAPKSDAEVGPCGRSATTQGFAAGRGYTLRKAKRELFAELTDAEVGALETAIRTAFEAA